MSSLRKKIFVFPSLLPIRGTMHIPPLPRFESRPGAPKWGGKKRGTPGPMPGGYGVMADDGSMDYSVHEAWNEATNVYLVVILVSFVLFMYAKRNKRKIMRIFSVPPTAETLSEPSFYDTISKIRLRQQLEMYSISRKYDYQQPQNQADSVQLSLE
ncbi:small integral membrane protein 19 isoform X1 [Phoca vitulina]|nr:small integral membrane protein 19 isoform X1 [Phoca vitulina]